MLSSILAARRFCSCVLTNASSAILRAFEASTLRNSP